MMVPISVSLRMRRSLNAPVAERSGGICAVFSHVPFTYLKKLSPGLTERSMAARSTPQVPNCGVAALRAKVLTPTQAKPASAIKPRRIEGLLLSLPRSHDLGRPPWPDLACQIGGDWAAVRAPTQVTGGRGD